MIKPRVAVLFAAVAALLPTAAAAAALPLVVNAPIVSPTIEFATQFDLKLHLPEGKGLARLLIDAGVNQDDAAGAARLAAGHMGAGSGGCDAKVSISRSSGSSGFRLVRVQLMTEADQTVLERRGAELTVASAQPSRKTPRLV